MCSGTNADKHVKPMRMRTILHRFRTRHVHVVHFVGAGFDGWWQAPGTQPKHTKHNNNNKQNNGASAFRARQDPTQHACWCAKCHHPFPSLKFCVRRKKTHTGWGTTAVRLSWRVFQEFRGRKWKVSPASCYAPHIYANGCRAVKHR